ncbi:MAG: HlyD family efflux transporter periplasmic adaptor subunit [Pseudomonadota bacterium]
MMRIISLLLLLPGLASAAPLLTGVVEDSSAQTIEMPRLPGGWQRRIEWMIPEGTPVAIGDVIARLDPGDLLTREEQTRSDLDKVRLSAERRIDELRLMVMEYEGAVAQAESDLRLAELDATIPETTIPRLDFERYQLTRDTARQTLIRSEAALLNRRAELDDVIQETALEVRQAEENHDRIRRALDATQIRATKAGFMIYGENPFTGTKVFPGETLYSGFEIAKIASREDLQVRFWVHEADIREVGQGQRIEVAADAQGSQTFMTELTWTSSQAVERLDWSDSGYFEALAQPIDELPADLMPGMSVLGVVSKEGSDQ